MKANYKFFVIFIFTIFTLSLYSCDVDFESGSGIERGTTTLTINGKSCKSDGYVSVNEYTCFTIQSSCWNWGGFRINVPSTLKELKSNDVLTRLWIEFYDDEFSYSPDNSGWKVSSGAIIIKDIQSNNLTIQFDNLSLVNNKEKSYTINGTIKLYNSRQIHDGTSWVPEPFN